MSVRAWSEQLSIPTYEVGAPNPIPMFLEKRVYQGSSGVVYPHPVIEQVANEPTPRFYTAVWLENEWIRVMILPELGGRVQLAQDKTNGHHFVYHNRVIKPALVGLAGPWISGGIEFNWPQHHRPSTFQPVDWWIEEHADGSRTVWCNEVERMFGTQGRHGFTLHPDRALLEINARLYNGGSLPQTFLWWANPAVHVNDDYESVFPPDVSAVMDHGKRAVSDFPIATGEYYKMDYSPGTNIARYSTIPVPTSYMAYHSEYNFVGCYDHGRGAGMMHVADHHRVPGKKQWTWGCGEFGQAWDRQLTDEDGPYIELMCGAYTDNQPDFTWIMPGEEKRFRQVFMPYRGVGVATNASDEAVLRLVHCQGIARLAVYTTSPGLCTVTLVCGPVRRARLHNHKNIHAPAAKASAAGAHRVVFEWNGELDPGCHLEREVAVEALPHGETLTLNVHRNGHLLCSYTLHPDEPIAVPEPATPARKPAEIASVEELFLNGQHLEQYRHATWSPEPYYEEALRRDPLDSRCNNAMGLLLLRRGKPAEAEAYLRRATQRLMARNTNPCDGEPFHNLGLALRDQDRFAEARDLFQKAAWSHAWRSASLFEAARIDVLEGHHGDALPLLREVLDQNGNHHRARHLLIAVLRVSGETDAAKSELAEALRRDPASRGLRHEATLLGVAVSAAAVESGDFATMMAGLDYAHAGLYHEADALLIAAHGEAPLSIYLAGWVHWRRSARTEAVARFRTAAACDPAFFFPNITECVPALKAAAQVNGMDGVAAYGLGNFWYAHRQYREAVSAWTVARIARPNDPIVRRNLALAYVNKLNDPERAVAELSAAHALAPANARILFELDQLDKKRRIAPSIRLARLEALRPIVEQRDDLAVEYVTLLNLLGRHSDALALLTTRIFHPWEGGEGKTTGQYVLALVELAREAMSAGDATEALVLLDRARHYPLNLAEGKLHGATENNIHYHRGLALRALGRTAEANAALVDACRGAAGPTSAMYYNDQPPDLVFYRGLALRLRGEEAAADSLFRLIRDYGRDHVEDQVEMDYFAVSLPDFLVFDEDLSLRNRIHCLHMQALGELGLGNHASAAGLFRQVLSLEPAHVGATIHQRLLVGVSA